MADWMRGKHDVMVLIAAGYKENNHAMAVKKEVWQKSLAASQPWNEYQKIFHMTDDVRLT